MQRNNFYHFDCHRNWEGKLKVTGLYALCKESENGIGRLLKNTCITLCETEKDKCMNEIWKGRWNASS